MRPRPTKLHGPWNGDYLRLLRAGFLFVLTIGAAARVQAQAANFGLVDCSALKQGYVFVMSSEVFAGREPNISAAQVCPECRATGQQFRKKWDAEDQANFRQIANRLCSARAGWKEHVPGQCQAGGPPPICPVDHWYRVPPMEAEAAFAQMNRDVANSRQSEMMAVMCECYLKFLRNSDNRVALGGRAPVNRQSSNGFSVLDPVCASDGSCPMLPGATCTNGYCRLPTAPISKLDILMQSAGETGKSTAEQKATMKMLVGAADLASDEAGVAVATITGSTLFGVVLGIVQPTTIGSSSATYNGELAQLNTQMNHLKGLYSEAWNAQGGQGPERSLEDIQVDIAQTKTDVRNTLTNMAVAADGVVRDNELGPHRCPNVFQYEHGRVAQYATALLSLPDHLPGVP